MTDAVRKPSGSPPADLDQTDRLVEKFNTALTINYFERHPEDRTQNFEIASKEKVAEYLFGDKAEKKASADHADEYHDYSCYDSREMDYFAPPAEKTAEEKDSGNPDLEDRHGVSGYSTESLQRLVLKRASDHAEQAKFIMDQVGMIRDEIATELSKIASAVVSGYDPDERYAMFKAACGGMPAFASFDGLVPDWVKKASEKHERSLRRANVIDLGDMQPLVSELEKIAEVSAGADEFEKEAEKHEAYRRNILDRLEKIAQLPGSPNHAPGSGEKGDKGKGKDKSYNDAADFLGLGSGSTLAPKGLSEYMGGGFIGSASDIDKAIFPKKKKDTSIMDHINNLRRSTILQDLYDNDPILSEADPNDLANAYNSLVQSAPEASLNKEVARAILRQSVNAMAVSPFDAKQWADLDNVLLKNKSYSKGEKSDKKDKDDK